MNSNTWTKAGTGLLLVPEGDAMTQDGEADDPELKGLREFLLGAPDSDTGKVGIDLGATSPRSELDEGLRQWGFNRPEREEIRWGPRSPRRNYDDVNFKRFKHYIRGMVRKEASDLDVAGLALEWAELTGYNVDLARRFWDAGFDVVDPGRFAAFISEGFGLHELEEAEVQGKTVAQHLHEKQSVRWCINALHFSRRRSS